MNFSNLKMMLHGYRRVAIKDTKEVLDKTNNFKWVKTTNTATYTVLPTGTIIEEGIGVYGNDFKKIIKPNGRMVVSQHNLPYGQYNIPTPGSYVISEYEKCHNAGTKYKPNYLPSGSEKVYKSKTPEEIIAERNAKKEQALKEQRTKKRLKYIEEFNKKFKRKDIKGKDGSRSKYVIDKETDRIVSFWRRDSKGKISSGRIFNIDELGYREIGLMDKDNNLFNRTVQHDILTKKGRVVKTSKIPSDGDTEMTGSARTINPKGKVVSEQKYNLF